MLGFLIFYYCFSVLYIIGYTDFDDIDGIWISILAVITILVLAPILLPVNLGDAVCKIYRRY